jgi:Xaa-Pro aminopeptidase
MVVKRSPKTSARGVQDYRAQAQRRRRLIKQMGEGIAFIPNADECLRNADTHYPYRFDSHFWYLTGFPEPESVLVLIGGKSPRSILFCRTKNLEREIWDGYRYGPKAAQQVFGFTETYPIDALDEMAPALMAGQHTLFYPIGANSRFDSQVMAWLNQVRGQVRRGIKAPTEFFDIRGLIDEMRLVKDRSELRTMKRSADIAAQAHIRAMTHTQPGMFEYEIEAELLNEFRRQGAQAPAYNSIVAGGANACVLHYIENSAPLADQSLLLIDAGCELDGYASDITRTFPVNGTFTDVQRDCYEIVLAAQKAAIQAVKPGAPFTRYHDAAVKVLAQGLIDLKLLKGPVARVIESGDYRRFYMHRTGHWLGLDVHDVGSYSLEGKPRKLVPGNVLTVEPGLYIRPDRSLPRAFWNIGIRIEDDVLVTDTGCEVLTSSAPKEIDDIESLMSQ